MSESLQLLNATCDSCLTNLAVDQKNRSLKLKAPAAAILSNAFISLESVVNQLHEQLQANPNLPFNNNNDPTNLRSSSLYKALCKKLQDVKYLQIYSSDTPELHGLSLEIYSALDDLHIHMVPPSTIDGIVSIRNQLKRLRITNSGIVDLSTVLIPDGIDKKSVRRLSPLILPGLPCSVPSKYNWQKLISLQLVNCGITNIDQSLHFFPSLVELDLSHNSIAHLIHLQDCISLKYLNISHNRLRGAPLIIVHSVPNTHFTTFLSQITSLISDIRPKFTFSSHFSSNPNHPTHSSFQFGTSARERYNPQCIS